MVEQGCGADGGACTPAPSLWPSLVVPGIHSDSACVGSGTQGIASVPPATGSAGDQSQQSQRHPNGPGPWAGRPAAPTVQPVAACRDRPSGRRQVGRPFRGRLAGGRRWDQVSVSWSRSGTGCRRRERNGGAGTGKAVGDGNLSLSCVAQGHRVRGDGDAHQGTI